MTDKKTTWMMLFSRITLFAALQALLALVFLLTGTAHPWESAAAWWPITVATADLISLGLLIAIHKSEAQSYWRLFRIDRSKIWADLLALLGVTLVSAPFSVIPNLLLGQALFGSSEATLEYFIRPLPISAVYLAMLVFPLGQSLTELPTYFGFISPRLRQQGMNKWIAVLLPALMLGIQHIAAPLLFDVRFILWRGLMFIPFAILTGLVFYWRPRLLPYFLVVHFLMNISFVTMFLNSAY